MIYSTEPKGLEFELCSRLSRYLQDNTIRSATTNRSVGWETSMFIYSCVQGGVEREVLQYLDKHPDADLSELRAYRSSLLPPLEIVDDEDLEEDEL